ncbi:molybdate ABC transporter substrate-binding protein [Aquibacillus halophilus]|uniref:Molybdate ABC transporter substrate-binding protein n=1 Tax=Aquibacillus halophilus TaxID=930132 RepID=A0A6A8DH54_9BACI|nr:molybdate ABC transporter substrate-binding protein [Aquibacillus halophilus]MRH44560.1 molybdate ABC transporter substrate-binding protein [Aquibacillus halophilus]
MKKSRHYHLFLIGIIILLSACSMNSTPNENQEENIDLTISAASSMVEVLEELRTNFEQENNTINVSFNFGSSGSLQQQIAHGAPVDIFISAAEDKFHPLLDQGMIVDNYYTTIVENELVLIEPTHQDNKMMSFDDLLGEEVQTIAIGTPETVPAGYYAKELLENLELYDLLQEKLIPTKDVRQVLNYVETGNTRAGIVYRTDALSSNLVRIVETASKESHSPINYPIGVLKQSQQKEAAILFFNYITSEKSLKIFEEYGFVPVRDS